ncbi:beta-lactamase family protein [candidate division KSB1 bacterium]|nr:beta-lactamase family protein [candidate division KSB1 bacterium]
MLQRVLMFSLIFSIFAPLSSQAQMPLKDSRFDSLLSDYDQHVASVIEESGAPGVAIAIVKDGQLVFVHGYGVRKMGSPEKVNMHTVFRLASVSKGFAAVLTGLLVNDGIISWDDRIIDYLPEFRLADTTNTKQLTIKNILSHTSGVVPHAYDNLIEAQVPYYKIMQELHNAPVGCEPGTYYGYQNAVYSLIGEVIREATGKSYRILLKERIFKPLNMIDASSTRDDLVANENYARPHVRRYGQWTPVHLRDTYYNVCPAAGVNASAWDMGQWMIAMLGDMPQIIPHYVLDEVTTPVVRTRTERRRFNYKYHIKRAYYGLGWRVFNYDGETMVFHSGGLRGYQAKVAMLPEHNVGIAVLQHSGFHNRLAYEFIDMYLDLHEELYANHAD